MFVSLHRQSLVPLLDPENYDKLLQQVKVAVTRGNEVVEQQQMLRELDFRTFLQKMSSLNSIEDIPETLGEEKVK
jgi:hypothetical protein